MALARLGLVHRGGPKKERCRATGTTSFWIDLEMDFPVFKHFSWVGMGLSMEVADDDANEKIQSLKTSDRQGMLHGKRCLFGRTTAMFLIERQEVEPPF